MGAREDNYDKYLDKLEEVDDYQRIASDSTGTNIREIPTKNLLVMLITDPHNKDILELLMRAASIGAVVAYNGDYTNNQLTFSKNADVYADAATPQGQLRLFARTLEKAQEQGIDLSNLTVGIIDGNHEYRLYKATSIRQTYWMSKSLGIEDKYAANALKCTFKFVPIENKDLEYSFNMFMRHGEGNSVNNGRNATQALENPQLQGADLYITGHTHGFNFANKILRFPGPNGEFQYRTSYAANFGSMQYGSEYADRAGYPLSPRLNGEILNITIIQDKVTKKPRACVELINMKDILTPEFTELLESTKRKFKKLENGLERDIESIKAHPRSTKTFMTPQQAREECNKILKNSVNKLIQLNNSAVEVNDKFSFGTISGCYVGDPEKKNQALIKEYIDGLALAPNLYTVITGNNFYVSQEKITKNYTKNEELAQNFVDEIFVNMYNAAKKIKPIAKSVIGYHYAAEENKILAREHKELLRRLAKKAIKTLQIDESLVFEDMDEAEVEKEITARQAKVLEKANKEMIADRIKTMRKHKPYMDQFYAWLEKKREKHKDRDYDSEDELNNYVGFLLRREGKFLSLQGTPEINKTIPGFKIDTTDIKTVAKDIISNIFLTMMGLMPEEVRKVKVQHQVNQPVMYQIPLVAPDGSKRTFNMLVRATESTAERQAQENYAKKDASNFIGFDLIVNSPKSSQEFVTKSTTAYLDIKGEQHIIDSYHIVTPSLTGPNKYVNVSLSEPRIYMIKATEKDPYVREIETTGNTLYRSKGKYTYYLEDLDYRHKIDYSEMQLQSLSIAYDQALNAMISCINKANTEAISPDGMSLVRKAYQNKQKELREAEKAKSAQKQQKVVTAPVEEVVEETNEEVLEDDALKVG